MSDEFEDVEGDSRSAKAAKAFLRQKIAEGCTKQEALELSAKMIAEKLRETKPLADEP